MAVLRTRFFAATLLRPKAVPDGRSLEEQMNAFLNTLPMAMVVDVTQDFSKADFHGMIVYQAGA